MDIGSVVGEIVAIRDELKALRAEFKAEESRIKASIDEKSMWLRDRADELGVDSFKTHSGTAYRGIKTYYRVGSWEDFITWVKDTDNFQCLERRVAKKATQEVHNETGEVPPGVEYGAEVEILVRRPSTN